MKIGRFIIFPTAEPGKVWISLAGDGEGGVFSETELDAVLLAFYRERF